MGLLEGYYKGSSIRIQFDMRESVAFANIVDMNGYAANVPINLRFDKISGSLTGNMNYAPVNLKLVNCDLYDFLTYIFIFLK